MEQYLNAVKRHVSNMDAQNAQPRFGVVQSYNPNNHTARVMIQPEEVLSGWLPVATGMSSNGWGIVVPPIIGTQVLMTPVDGDNGSMVIVGSVYSKTNQPPKPSAAIAGAAAPVVPGEIALVSQDGNVVIRLGADGTLYIKSSVSVNIETQTANVTSPTINVVATTGLNVTAPLSKFTGNIIATGDISDQNAARGTLAGLRTNYDTHAHTGVQPGGGTTGTTNKPIGS